MTEQELEKEVRALTRQAGAAGRAEAMAQWRAEAMARFPKTRAYLAQGPAKQDAPIPTREGIEPDRR